MGAAAFLVGSALVAGTATLVAASLRLRAIPAFLLAAYLIADAEIVGLAEILSPFHGITRSGYLSGTAVVVVAAAAVWWVRGRPMPPSFALGRVRELRSHPVLLLLGAAVALGLVYELVVGLTTPPNNWDAMWHQLVRTAAWRQQHTLAPVRGVNDELGVNASPPNAELQMLFGLVLAGRDTFATMPQFLAECALLLSVFGIARRVGFAPAAAAFAALLTGTLSEIALQSVTAQDDLAAAAVVAAATFFVLGRTRADTILAGLAVGLAVGTKVSVALALPAVALVALAVGRARRVVALAAISLLSFACFGAYIYLQHTENAATVTSVPTGNGSMRAESSAVDAVSTAARVLYDFVDLTGFHHVLGNRTALVLLFFTLPLVIAVFVRSWWRPIVLAASVPFVVGAVGIAAAAAFRGLHIPLNPPNATSTGHFSLTVNTLANESSSYYGPVGTLLLFPLSVWGCVAWARGRVDRRVAALASALPIAVLAFALMLSYTPYVGRYFIGPVALVMPLAALVYRRPVLARAAALVGVLVLAVAHVFNLAKPIGLAGSTPVWSLTRADAQALEWTAMRPVLRRVAKEVPENARVGVVLDAQDWSYPFFGSRLGREVTYLEPGDSVGAEAAARHVSWLIVHDQPWRWQIRNVSRPG
jgi:hypothetical protein